MENIKLSVCLIVKNEEDCIENCLKCAKQFADEIVIVDTGSTDKTIDIAKKYTDKIFLFEWQNDFAKARNFAFQKAHGEYLMWLDADDIISKSEINKIKQLKPHLSCDTYMLKYVLLDAKKQPFCTYFRERIVKNCNKAKWHGFIHETITPFGKIENLDIKICHNKNKTSDPKHNLKIYNFHLKNGAILSGRELYYYAKELFYNGYYSKCIKELKKYLKTTKGFYPNVLDATLTLARCYAMQNRSETALKTLLTGLIYLSATSEYLCEIGQLFIEKSDYKNAKNFYLLAIDTPSKEALGVFEMPAFREFVPHYQLSVCYFKLGEMQQAKKHFLLAKSFDPNHPLIRNNSKYFTDNNSA